MFKFLVPLVLAVCLLNACARAPRTPTEIPPTSTPIVYPATWTPVLTPMPPTATPLPATRTPDPDTLEVAKSFERTKHLTVYHSSLDVVINDPTGTIAEKFPQVNPNGPIVMLSMEGRRNLDASHWKMRGLLLACVCGSVDEEIEFISSGSLLYLNGPILMLGINDDRWYAVPRSAQNDLTADTTAGFLLDFSSARAPLPEMRRAGVEKMDGKPCIKYHGDEAQAAEFFLSLDANGSIRRNLYKVDGDPERGYLDLWVCDDGYIHKLAMGIQIQARDQQGQYVAVGFTIRVNDMNIIVPIETPQDAIPLPNPFVIPGYGDPNPAAKPTDQTA